MNLVPRFKTAFSVSFKDILSSLILVLFIVIWSSPNMNAQSIAINEILASNSDGIADEDGDNEDWIELFNYGTEAISLEGYGLSEDSGLPHKWVFGDAIINPGEHFLIWASGKDRQPSEESYRPGLIREVWTGIPGIRVSDLTNHHSYPDNPDSKNVVLNFFESPVDIGDHYGQKIHGFIKAPLTGNYIFWISGDDNCELYLSTDTDPGNTARIARVTGWTNPRQWDKYSEQRSEPVMLEAGKYYYIKALMKEHEGGDNLAVGWMIPGGTFELPIPGNRIWTYQTEFHTNFRISASGETLTLTSPEQQLIDLVPAVNLPTDISFGRVPDGTGEWFYFETPTPGSKNTTEAFNEVLHPPYFSAQGGFYMENFDLSISHTENDITIIYTLDGSEPEKDNLEGSSYHYKNVYPQNPGNPFGSLLSYSYHSHIYSAPISIYDRSSQADKLSRISTTYNRDSWYFPITPVKKGIIVKAKAFKPGAIPSATVANSYFVNSQGKNPYTLPLISISLQEDHMFGYEKGFYVAGKTFDDWRSSNPSSSSNGGTPANYWLPRELTESPGHIEFFEKNSSNASLNQGMGICLHGGWSKSHPQKSLRLYARSSYGNSTFDHQFFPDYPYSSFKRLILRNSGNDNWQTQMRDASIQSIVSHLDFDTQEYQPSIVYINGEYWGIHNIRERYDKHYLARVYGVDPENIDLLETWGSTIEGDPHHYFTMIDFVGNNPLSIDANYKNIEKRIDISCFIDYQISQIFAANTDWPGNNLKLWRVKTYQYIPDAPKGSDGRWRWLMYDTDFGFGFAVGANHNTLQFATQANGPSWPNPDWSTFLLRELLENQTFRYKFINRFADLLNTAFLPQRMVDIINSIRNTIQPEISEHQHRWKMPQTSLAAWNNEVNKMINFANQRPLFQRHHIRNQFNITGEIDIVVDVDDQESGLIRLNTIDISPSTPGVDIDPYPWTGKYFQSIPIRVEAVAKAGHEFSHWEGSSTGSDPILHIIPTANIFLKAYFTKSESPESQIVHYWHFNELNGTVTEVESDYSAVGRGIITYPGTGSGYMDERTHRAADPVSNLNLQMDQEPDQGAVLRARNPSDTRALVIEANTTGYKNIEIAFATARTSNGATQQELYYSADAGNEWIAIGSNYTVNELPSWELKNFDLSSIPETNDNAQLRLRILFKGDQASGTSGNNRFDNISVTGTPKSSSSHALLKQQSLAVIPNPAHDHFILDFGNGQFSPGLLNIYDITGKLIKSISIEDTYQQIHVGDFQPGIYIINFVSKELNGTARLIKASW